MYLLFTSVSLTVLLGMSCDPRVELVFFFFFFDNRVDQSDPRYLPMLMCLLAVNLKLFSEKDSVSCRQRNTNLIHSR
jgi:hypothetical protein